MPHRRGIRGQGEGCRIVLTPFIVIGGIGLVVLVLSLVLGDIFDHFDIGDGAISGTALGIAAVVFGAAGVLTSTNGLDLVWAYVLAAVLAVLAYLVAVFFVKRLDASSDGVPASAVGLTGVTRSTVSPAGGEVSLDGPQEIERRMAFADETIDEGVRIRVVEHAGTRVKVVAEQ